MLPLIGADVLGFVLPA